MASPNPFDGRTLYRYFDTIKHAKALARGYVWIGTLQRCRQFENQQQGDPGEGLTYYHTGAVTEADPDFQKLAIALLGGPAPNAVRSRFRDNRIIDIRSMSNDAFLLCTSLRFDPKAFKAAWKAPHCTEIIDAGRFYDLVTRRIAMHFRRNVEGTIGEITYLERGYITPDALAKPSRYAGQDEVRMVWTVEGQQPPYEPFLLHVPEVATLCRRRFS